MEKLSTYQILGYLVPGYGTLFLLNKLFKVVPDESFSTIALDQVVPVFILSLIVGIILQTMIDKLKPKDWFKNSLYRHASVIIWKNEFVKEYPKIMEILEKDYLSISGIIKLNYRNKSGELVVDVDENSSNYPTYLFDFAYNYLESKNADAEVKSLHGLYYLMRNLFFVSVIFFFYYLLMWTFNDFVNYYTEMGIFLLGSLGTYYSAIFMREKYICKTILIYYADRMHARAGNLKDL